MRPNKLHKTLFNWFKAPMIQLAYMQPSKDLGIHPAFEFAFHDNSGRKYYKVKHDDTMPILRKAFIASQYVNFASGISEADVSETILSIHNAIHETDDKGKMKPNIARIGYMCAHLMGRRGTVIHYESFYKLTAAYFVREDEDFDCQDEAIFIQKAEDLKTLPLDIMRKFFFDKSINTLFPFLDKPEELFNELLEEGKIVSTAYLEQLKAYNNGSK